MSSVTIPNSVISIAHSAFSDCTNLTSINIPDSVISVGSSAFSGCTGLTNLAIPNSVASIGNYAFRGCKSLSSVTIGNGVTNIGYMAFSSCGSLETFTVDALNPAFSSLDGVLFNKSQTALIAYPGGKAPSYTIPGGVTTIGRYAFAQCLDLVNVTIPGTVTNIEEFAFAYCPKLTEVFFRGNAPSIGSAVFTGNNQVIVCYLPGTTGWGSTFGERPTALWKPRVLTSDGSFGVRTNQFGFNISWASGMAVAVDACTDLANPVWTPLQTNTLSGDTLYFGDSQWTNHPARFYRLRWP